MITLTSSPYHALHDWTLNNTCSPEILMIHQDGNSCNPLVYNKAGKKCPKIKIHIQVSSLWKILQLKEAITGDSILTAC